MERVNRTLLPGYPAAFLNAVEPQEPAAPEPEPPAPEPEAPAPEPEPPAPDPEPPAPEAPRDWVGGAEGEVPVTESARACSYDSVRRYRHSSFHSLTLQI